MNRTNRPNTWLHRPSLPSRKLAVCTIAMSVELLRLYFPSRIPSLSKDTGRGEQPHVSLAANARDAR